MSKGDSYSEKTLTPEFSILKEENVLKFLTLIFLNEDGFPEKRLGQGFILEDNKGVSQSRASDGSRRTALVFPPQRNPSCLRGLVQDVPGDDADG